MTESTARKIKDLTEEFISKIKLSCKEEGILIEDWYFEKDSTGDKNLYLYLNGAFYSELLAGSDSCISILINEGA